MRVAAFQRLAIFDAVGVAADVMLRDIAWADANGVDLVVFPEAYLQGHTYSPGLTKRRALSLDDPRLLAVIDQTRTTKATAIVGFFERRADGVYNSAMVIAGGRLKGVYAKANPIETGCLPGSAFPVWDIGDWRFGINICSDLRRSELAQTVANRGAGLICCPMNMMLTPAKVSRWREPCLAGFRDCARQTGCWVVSSDVVGTNSEGWASYGCTVIVDPQGRVVQRVDEFVEGVTVFDLPSPQNETLPARSEQGLLLATRLDYIQ
jgi:predicted amidohydrolase